MMDEGAILDEYCEICDGDRPLRPEFIRRMLKQQNGPKIHFGSIEELDRLIRSESTQKC